MRQRRHRRSFPREGARPRKTPIHVVIFQRRWAVIRFGEREPLSLHDVKDAAISEARRVAAREGAEVLVFDLGGHLMQSEGDSLAG